MQPTVAPPPPRRRRTWPIVLGIGAAVVLLLCVGGLVIAGMVGGAKTSDQPGPEGQGAAGPVPAGLNSPARDGKFEFTVTKVQCGVSSVGDKLLNRKAQGQYCLVSVKVTNVGKEARTLAASSQYAYNSQGDRYSADPAGSFYVDDSGTLWEDINPGNTLVGTIVFDIPQGAKLARLELHDSALSGGVTVTLP